MQLLTFPTTCPKCGGRMYDNRTGHSKFPKKNPKAPDGKCANKACDGVVWPLKPGQAWADDAPAQAPQPAPEPPQYGGPMPWEAQETGGPPPIVVQPAPPVNYWQIFGETLMHLQAMARNGELTINGAPIPLDLGMIGQLVNTQYIAATRGGGR